MTTRTLRPFLEFATCTLLACLAMLAPRPAHAEAFVGGSIGRSGWPENPCDSGSCKRHDTAGTLRAGYYFSPYFGVEARYLDLSNFSTGSPDVVAPPGGQVFAASTKISARGAGVNAIATWPVNEYLSISGIAGISDIEVRQRIDFHIEPPMPGDPVLNSFDGKKRSSKPYYGVSVGFALTPAVVLSLEAERYRFVYGDSVPVDLFAVGLTYRFR